MSQRVGPATRTSPGSAAGRLGPHCTAPAPCGYIGSVSRQGIMHVATVERALSAVRLAGPRHSDPSQNQNRPAHGALQTPQFPPPPGLLVTSGPA